MTITLEQRRAASEAPVQVTDPETGRAYVLVDADQFQRMCEEVESVEDRREHEAWHRLARKARNQWAAENPY